MNNTLVIGDIHGCYAELQELLDQAGLTSEGVIIALGDIVDRGPETPEVVEFFRSHLHASSLLGNHERKHIRAARGELQPALSQRISQKQLGEGYSEALIWLETFPLFMELPDAVLVHGYLEPGVALEAQRERVLCGTIGGDHYLQAHYDRPWYELWDGGKPVIVGHLDYLRNGAPLVYQDRVFGLDTSCVHGGRLTGLVLPEFRFVSVPSRGDHWTALRQHYRIAKTAQDGTPKARIDFAQPWDEGSERGLEKVLAYVTAENERLLAQLHDHSEFVKLTPRQQAKAYSALIGRSPVKPLLHLTRRGELTKEKARRILGDAEQVEVDIDLFGL
jgi:serine/threonine protein phosphatase 1